MTDGDVANGLVIEMNENKEEKEYNFKLDSYRLAHIKKDAKKIGLTLDATINEILLHAFYFDYKHIINHIKRMKRYREKKKRKLKRTQRQIVKCTRCGRIRDINRMNRKMDTAYCGDCKKTVKVVRVK